jgi:hypothetical protein
MLAAAILLLVIGMQGRWILRCAIAHQGSLASLASRSDESVCVVAVPPDAMPVDARGRERLIDPRRCRALLLQPRVIAGRRGYRRRRGMDRRAETKPDQNHWYRAVSFHIVHPVHVRRSGWRPIVAISRQSI